MRSKDQNETIKKRRPLRTILVGIILAWRRAANRALIGKFGQRIVPKKVRRRAIYLSASGE